MEKNKQQGKYIKPRKRKPVLLVGIFCLSLAVILGLVIGSLRQRQQERELAQRVHAADTTAQTTIEQTALPETAPETQAATEPSTAPTQPPVLEKYRELSEENPDLFGWITIEDTKIDYPVMYTPEEPEKYLHLSFQQEYSYGGTPFLEDACDLNSDNIIIYAHNMTNGTMFRDLIKYEQKNFWQAHPTIRFDTLYEEGEYEVLAAFYDRVYKKTDTCFKFYQFINAEDEADFNNALENYREKALYDTGVTAEYGDQLITLVTCAYHTDNGRFVVVARKK